LACSKALPTKPSDGFFFATFLDGRLPGENQSLSLADKVVLPPIYDPLRFAIRPVLLGPSISTAYATAMPDPETITVRFTLIGGHLPTTM